MLSIIFVEQDSEKHDSASQIGISQKIRFSRFRVINTGKTYNNMNS